MKLFKRNKRLEDVYDIDDIIDKSREDKTEEDEEAFDPNGLENVIDRVEGGLIGSLRIANDINFPLFMQDDIVHLRAPQRILKKDIVLYKDHDEYYLRRIIKYKDDGMYVAGDNERAYHIIHKEDIIAKAIARERGNDYLSLTLQQCNPLYTFIKAKLAFIRLGNRVIEHEQDLNTEALEAAKQVIHEREEIKELKVDLSADMLDIDLSSFKDPNSLVHELNSNKPLNDEPKASLEDEASAIEASEEDDEIITSDDEINEELPIDYDDFAPEENSSTDEEPLEASDDNKEKDSSLLAN